MKKTLIAVAAAAALTTSAFAEVTFGGWGRAIWTPAASNGDKTYSYLATSWGWNPRMGYSMAFTSENVDLITDFALEKGFNDANGDACMAPAINDQLRINVRPADGVQLSIGKILDDTLRGDCSYGSWNWLRPNWFGGMMGASYKAEGDGLTFSRTLDLNMGVAAKITAIENLVIVAGLPVPMEGGREETSDVFKKAKIAAGYTIDGVGQIKAQFLGKGPASNYGEDDTGDLEVAFKLTSVENLTAEAGLKMQIKDDSDAANKLVALGASYKVNDACTVNADVAVTLYGNSDVDPSMAFGAGVDYALDNGIGLTTDLRVAMPQNDIDPSIAFLLGASKGFSNGKLSVGFQVAKCAEMPDADKQFGLAGNLKASDETVWAIPVCFEYWF